MPSKFDRLRAGEVVDIEPGRKGRLNLKDKTFETSDGRKTYVGDDEDFFPSSQEKLLHSREKEAIERGIKQSPTGEFGFQFSESGAVGGIKDWGSRFVNKGEEYLRKKRARQEVSERISEESPWTSMAAKTAEIIPEVLTTKGMTATKALPLLTGLSAGSRVLDEPGRVAGEMAGATIGGVLLDKGGKLLNSISERRGAVRALPAQQEAARAQNVAGKAAMDQSNLAKGQQYSAEKLKVKNENALREHQFKVDLDERANRLQEHKNEIKQKKIDRDIEVERIKNEKGTWEAEDKLGIEKRDQEIKRMEQEYELKNQQYKEDLRKHPELKRKAQEEHSQNVQKSVDEIVNTIPKETKINSDLIGVGDFIGEKIAPTPMAGTREAAQVSKILKSLFPEGESFTAKDLGKKYGLLEDAIKDSHPAVADYLSRFKEHLGERIPSIVKDNTIHSKLMPILAKQIEKDIAEAVKKISLPFSKNNAATRNAIAIKANDNLRRLLQEIGPENFAKKLQSGEITKMFNKGILTADDLLISAGVNNAAKLRKSGEFDVLIKPSLNKAHKNFVNDINRGIEESLYKNDFKAMELGANAEKRLGESLKKTFGMAPPIEPPIAPHAPGSPQNPHPPEYVAPQRTPSPEPPEVQETVFSEPRPTRPAPIPEPGEPSYGRFKETAEPQLPPAQGFAQHAGDFLEKPPMGGLMGGRDLVNNPLVKLSGLKYLLKGAAMPSAAAYAGLKGLTSPTTGGALARMTFKQGGIQAIVSWAQKYPSYHDGVLENPQERRSLTREIEDDPDMPLEQKAIIQSKVNRGKPLEGNLH